MKIQVEGRKVLIRGDSSLSKTMVRAIQDTGEGYLV